MSKQGVDATYVTAAVWRSVVVDMHLSIARSFCRLPPRVMTSLTANRYVVHVLHTDPKDRQIYCKY